MGTNSFSSIVAPGYGKELLATLAWVLSYFYTIFKQWELLSDKPVYLSESGADSYMTIEKDDT